MGTPRKSDVPGDEGGTAVADCVPTRYLPRPEVRDMPEAPPQYWRLIGPGIIAAGVGLASGEFILFPYIASQVGLVFVWAAMVGLATQFVLNMEIERYTLATGRDRADRVQPVLAALGSGVRDHDLLRQPLAGLGDQLRDAGHATCSAASRATSPSACWW